jgi:RES domain-containing protein
MRAALPDPSIGFRGPLYRALNPFWAREPLSGEGARRFGGRFNQKGRSALYTSLGIMGAVAEANQIGRPFEPVTLVCYQADQADLFDATDASHLAARGVDPALLAADDWRAQMIRDGLSSSQAIAETLAVAGYAGMIVPSFAKGCAPGSRNLVLWRWEGLQLIDSENRLK